MNGRGRPAGEGESAGVGALLATIGGQIVGIALPGGARQYLRGAAIQAIVTAKHTSGLLVPGTAAAALAAYAAVILAIASRLMAARYAYAFRNADGKRGPR